MKGVIFLAATILLSLCVSAGAQKYHDSNGKIKVAIVKQPYSGARNVAELSAGPDILASGGVMDMLTELGCEVKDYPAVRLTSEEEDEYGEWHRLALANSHLCDLVAANEKAGSFNLGFLANCNGLLGMLGGLQRSGGGPSPLRIGLVWIDAHGDFNTPETTLSGMLGGMPVAVAAGMCLHRIRTESGLEVALPTKYIVMCGVRDLDPLERELLDRSDVEMITVDDLRHKSDTIHARMQRLSELTDKIYVHIDMDVLDPREVSGHGLTVPGGVTSDELAAALTLMFSYEKTAALGIAPYPAGRDEEKLSLKAAYTLVRGAIEGIKACPAGFEPAAF